MEFKINVFELQTIFSKLSHVVRMTEGNFTSMIMVESKDGGVVFKATDGTNILMITAQSDQCELISEGKTLLKFADVRNYVMRFVPLVDTYGTKEFHVIANDAESMIKSTTTFPSGKPSHRRLKLATFNADGYPAIVKSFDEAQLVMNSNVFKRGIGRVLHCINPNEVRKAMTGVCVTLMDDKIVFAGTNGIKLADFEFPINADIHHKSYIFSYNFASTLRNVLDDDAQVFMKLDEGRFGYVKSNNIYMIGNLIVGDSFPDYKNMFELTNVVSVPRLDFYDSVRTVLDVLDTEDNSRLSINISGNQLSLKSTKSEFTQEFDAEFETSLDVDVNGLFFESLLKDFIGSTIELWFSPSANYIVMRSSESPNHTALITLVKRR